MSKYGHFIKICRECKTIIEQCRCMTLNKEKRYGLCEKCSRTKDSK